MKVSFFSLLTGLTVVLLSCHSLAQSPVEGLDKPQIRFADIKPHLARIEQSGTFVTTEVGHSYLGTPIYRVSTGKGPVKVLMWSQMHGDESTATPALFDLMNYIEQNPDWHQSWADKISLHMIPMLNPDGAEMAQRYNAQGIDVNRDARVLQTPEGRTLMQQAKLIEPDIGFNLHDQSRYYEVGHTGKTATISLLAPAFNVAKDINDERRRAMQLIGVLKEVGDKMIAGHMGRYDDTFAPRAFGDTLAKMGISTILIESGAYKGDPHRQVARKVNMAMLIRGLDSIASGDYEQQSLDPYHSIPMNNSNSFKDLIVRNLTIVDGEHQYKLDIGINIDEGRAYIREVGDLSVFPAFNEVDGSGYQYQAGKPYAIESQLVLTKDKYLSLLKQGYSHFTGDAELIDNQSPWPVAVNPSRVPETRPQRQQDGLFLLRQQGQPVAAVIQGQWLTLK